MHPHPLLLLHQALYNKRNRSVTNLNKAFLDDISLDKLWKLNCGGRYVEDIMVKAIKHCAFDYPCLSFVLNLVDPVKKSAHRRKNLLAEEKIKDINSYRRVSQ